VTADEALVKLGQSTTEAVCGVLEMFAPGQITPGEVAVVAGEKHPLEGIPMPAVATMVSYIDGVTGGNLFVMTVDGARRLAAAMMGTEPDAAAGAEELSELELSAVAEAMNQMMASAAGATSAVLGTEVEIGVPETRTFSSAEQALDAYARTPHATRAAVSVCGEPCRLVQLVPNAFVVRMSGALDELGSELPLASDAGAPSTAGAAGGATGGGAAGSGSPSLAGITVRVAAELGRARMASADIVGLPSGAVVELNRQADEPIDLYVNGRRFATGRLMVVDGTDWAVRIESILGDKKLEEEVA
jgi:flagellar motor switch protein FliN